VDRSASPAGGGRRRLPLIGLVGSFFVSEVGTAASAVALPWLVLVTTNSAGRTGLTGFVEMTPYVLLQATSGPLADRWGWRRTSVAGNALAAAAVGAVPLLSALGALSFGALLALVAVAGAARGTADAATLPLVPGTAVLGEVSNERAAGAYSAANRAGVLIGMPLAGLLIGVTSPATVVLIDALTFAAAAIGLAVTIPAAVQDRARADGPPERFDLHAYLADLAEGLRFLRADRLLLGVATLVALTNLLDQALTSVLLPVWARDELHEATGVGIVGGTAAVGALVGVVVGAWLGERLPRHLTFAAGYLLGGAPPFFALAAVATLPVPVVVAALAGFFGGFLNPIIGAVSYERIPPELQARVLGAVKASAWLGLPLGSLLGGVLVQGAGLDPALVTCGVIMLLATAAPSVFPVWRQMNRRAADVVDEGVSSQRTPR
jgi:MFS family permease